MCKCIKHTKSGRTTRDFQKKTCFLAIPSGEPFHDILSENIRWLETGISISCLNLDRKTCYMGLSLLDSDFYKK